MSQAGDKLAKFYMPAGKGGAKASKRRINKDFLFAFNNSSYLHSSFYASVVGNAVVGMPTHWAKWPTTGYGITKKMPVANCRRKHFFQLSLKLPVLSCELLITYKGQHINEQLHIIFKYRTKINSLIYRNT